MPEVRMVGRTKHVVEPYFPRLIRRAKEVGKLLLSCKDEFRISSIILYGSVARGTADYLSDVDLMLVIDSTIEFCTWVESQISERFLEETMFEFPTVDVRTCSKVNYEDVFHRNDNPAHGEFIDQVRKDGMVIWCR